MTLKGHSILHHFKRYFNYSTRTEGKAACLTSISYLTALDTMHQQHALKVNDEIF